MAEVESLLDRYAIDPLDNPWEALALLAARILEAERIMSDRIGDLSEADVKSAEVAAWERYLQLASRVVTDASKLDLDERKFKLSQIQVQAVLNAITSSLDTLGGLLADTIPPPHGDTARQIVRDQYPAILATALRQHGTQPTHNNTKGKAIGP